MASARGRIDLRVSALTGSVNSSDRPSARRRPIGMPGALLSCGLHAHRLPRNSGIRAAHRRGVCAGRRARARSRAAGQASRPAPAAPGAEDEAVGPAARRPGHGRILPPDALGVPVHGSLNVHASLLPELRGAAPAQWAVARQYRETGVTIMQMDEGLDTGDIRLQRKIALAPDETGESLLFKLGRLGADTLTEALGLLAQGRLPRIPQDHVKATLAPLLSREDGRVDWNRTAAELDARRRGFTPWPGAWTTVDGAVLKIQSARPGKEAHAGACMAAGRAPETRPPPRNLR
ncbi:MAG: hypothetical protein E6J86_13320 [Deltaproteobacteria bacterium]|nr:MAG: hypothetical protein E6J86_13320 [Deltaproteobacteria bacterium]